MPDADGTTPTDPTPTVQPSTRAPSTGAPSTAAAGSYASRAPDWVILLVVCIGQFMVILDVSIVNVALPSIRESLKFSSADLQWVVTAYTLTFGGLLLLGGRLADIFGRRRLFLVGLVIFTGASLLGGFANEQGTLIAARAVQGVGGAVLAPATLTIITVTFTDPARRARAFGVWSAVAAGGGAAGALFGGVLTEYLSWRWILFVNVPVGIAAFILARFTIRESIAAAPRRTLDVAGAVTVTAGLITLVYAIVRTDTYPWLSAHTLGMLAVSAVCFGAFAVIESRVATDPLVPLRLFTSRALTGSNLAMFCFGASMFAMWFFLTLYLQGVLGLSPLQTGLAFVPQTAAIAAGATLAGRVAPRFGPRNVIVVGAVLASVGLYWLSMMTAQSTYWSGAFGGGLVCTFGMGLAFTPIAMAATGGVRPADAGLASGLVNTSRQVGASLGLALLATLAATRTQALQAAGVPLRVAETAGYAHGLAISACFALAAVFVAMLIPARPRPPAEGAGQPAAAGPGATSITPAPEPA